MGRYEAIGFLIAAKFVLRFGEASLLLPLLTGLGVKYILGA